MARRVDERGSRRLCGAALACGVMLCGAPAQAQNGNPLEALKPWLEKRLFGESVPSPDAAPAEEGAIPGEAPDGTVSAPPQAGADATDVPAAGPPAARAESAAATTDGAPASSSEQETAIAPIAPPPPEPLHFAVLAGRSAAATMADVGSVAETMARALGRPVEILPFPSYDAMLDAQVERRIDGGFFSASAYAIADTRCTCLEPLVAPRASDGTLSYRAIIVARDGAGISSAADLAGKTVAVGAADSLGSRRGQLAGLMREGIDPAAFGAVIEAGSAQTAIGLVQNRIADAAFAWSSMEGDPGAGYSRGTLADLVTDGTLSMDELVVVWRSPPIGHGPFAVTRDVPETDKARIESVLVGLEGTDPVAYDVLEPLYPGGYAPVQGEDYRGMETLMAADLDALDLPFAPASTGTTPLSPAGAAPAAP